jgi:hypothetical protein
MWYHNALDGCLCPSHIRYVGALTQCALIQGLTMFAQVIPALFRIEVLLCNVLIFCLFLITTPVSFRTASLTGAGSPLYSLTHSYSQGILPSDVRGIYFLQTQ